MPKWKATVVLIKTWEGIEVIADNESEAEMKMSNLLESELDKQAIPDDDLLIEDIEEQEDDEEEDTDEDR